MKALILVGGFGTRLRPLTFSCPKPLVDFANKPIVEHQMEALVAVGVTEIVLAISYQPTIMNEFIKRFESKHKVKVTCSLESEPLGTAGPIRLAQDILRGDGDGLFFVFNSDVICEYPLADLVAFHKNHGAEGTIMLTKVDDPSKYGVVLYDENGKIDQFVEKPQIYIGDKINAGLYIFNTEMISRIPLKPTSIEREIFPVMAAESKLYAMELNGIWMDIGQPKDYLKGHTIYLNMLEKKKSEILAKGEFIKGNVLIDASAKVSATSHLGPNVVIGANCIIGDSVRISNSIILSNSVIKQGAFIEGSIIGWKNTIGSWTRIQGMTVTGEDVKVADELFLNAAVILPNKSISSNIEEKGQIII